jgi:hypothetical protein
MRIAAKGRTDIEPIDAPGIAILSKPSETSRHRHSSAFLSDSRPGKRYRSELSLGHDQIHDSQLTLPRLYSRFPLPTLGSSEESQELSLGNFEQPLSQNQLDFASSSNSYDCLSPSRLFLQNNHFQAQNTAYSVARGEEILSTHLVGRFDRLKVLLRSMKWKVDHLILEPAGRVIPHFLSTNPNNVIDEIQCISHEIYQKISSTRHSIHGEQSNS